MSKSDLPYTLLLFGICSILFAIAGLLCGESMGRIGRMIYRTEEPSQFWQTTAMYFFIGICFIGYFLYKVYGLPN
jgi:hypothetical protein